MHQTFTGIYPSYLYDLTFLDERISNYYRADAITAKLFKIFAGLAVFISCLGLYGLISFMVVNRTREVGIRKVLGASINSILFLFSKEFMLLIVVAFLIAAPLGYYFMQGWLSGFYYHTAIGAGIFILAVFLSALVAWITVGYKAFSAALANPVKLPRSRRSSHLKIPVGSRARTSSSPAASAEFKDIGEAPGSSDSMRRCRAFTYLSQ